MSAENVDAEPKRTTLVRDENAAVRTIPKPRLKFFFVDDWERKRKN